MKIKSKLFATAVAFTMVLSLVAVPASAQTTAELTAQINSLLAMIAQLQAQIAGTTTSGAATTFNTDLTVGSTGADVVALQTFLVGRGYLVMPAGVAMGYFGPLTKAAVAAYQASAGIAPAVGYFGPLTRANVNALSATTGGTTTGTTGGTSTGVISTPGVEGTLTVTNSNSGLDSTVYEGDQMVPILGMKVEAKTSDIAIQRVKINLGTNSRIYTKGYSKLYVTDGTNVLASIDLNSSTVVKESSTYYITISGFNYVVPADTKANLVIKADVMGAIDSTDRTTLSTISLSIPANGVRGIDGAGIDEYSPTSALTGRSVTFDAELAESATLKLSLNSASPDKTDVVADGGSGDNELDNQTVLVFDLKAEKDDVKVTDMNIAVAKTGSGAATASTTVRIFDGSTELDSASISSDTAIFNDIDFVVPKDTTKTLTVKVDFRNADGTIANFVATATSTGITAENTLGDTVSPSGSATGYQVGVRNAGAEVSLVSKSITTDGVAQTNGTPVSTSTLSATFNVKVKAVGSDVILGTVASATPVFAKTGATNSFQLYSGGIASSVNNATSTSFTIPDNCSTGSLTDGCTLSENDEVTIPVTFQIPGRAATGSAVASGLYSVGLERVNWSNSSGTAQSSTFMAGDTDWRTVDVSFP